MCLVDDKYGADKGSGDVLGPSLPQGFKSTPAVVVLERNAKEIAHFAIKVGDTTLRVVDGTDNEVTPVTETVGKMAQGDALASARVTRDGSKAAIGHGPFNAPAK